MLRSRPWIIGRLSNTAVAFNLIIALTTIGNLTFASDVIKKPIEVEASTITNKPNNILNAVVKPDSSHDKNVIYSRSNEIKEASSTPPGYEIPKPVEFSGRIMQVTLGLAFVLAAIFAISWVAKRYGRFPSLPSNKFKILASISVGQRERVLLFQVGEQQLLLGVTAQSVQVLHKLDESIQSVDEPKKREPILSFSRRLQDELNDRVPQ